MLQDQEGEEEEGPFGNPCGPPEQVPDTRESHTRKKTDRAQVRLQTAKKKLSQQKSRMGNASQIRASPVHPIDDRNRAREAKSEQEEWILKEGNILPHTDTHWTGILHPVLNPRETKLCFHQRICSWNMI